MCRALLSTSPRPDCTKTLLSLISVPCTLLSSPRITSGRKDSAAAAVKARKKPGFRNGRNTGSAGEDAGLLESRSYALKLLANSFYGYLGFFGARWYCKECADATTAYARNYIKKTIHQAQEKGFPVIYSDTDSCMLLLGEKILSQAFEFMNEV